MKTKNYIVTFVEGWSANSHFGREIAARLRVSGEPIQFPTLAEARKALRDAKLAHGGSQPGRFDILERFESRVVRHYPWE